MDQQTDEERGIKIYTSAASTPRHDQPNPTPVVPPCSRNNNNNNNNHNILATPGMFKKRKIVAKGVQKTLSKTSLLANFLPTGTLLTFEMVLPSIYRTGECTEVSTLMITVLLILCTLSCFFFHFTDSFHGPDGKVYYGLVTSKGLAVFKPGLGVESPKDEKYKVGLNDLVHAVMSALVFVAIAFSDHRVTDCLFPGNQKELYEVMESFPLMVGVVCSGLFLVFPTNRYGIGCMAT